MFPYFWDKTSKKIFQKTPATVDKDLALTVADWICCGSETETPVRCAFDHHHLFGKQKVRSL